MHRTEHMTAWYDRIQALTSVRSEGVGLSARERVHEQYLKRLLATAVLNTSGAVKAEKVIADGKS